MKKRGLRSAFFMSPLDQSAADHQIAVVQNDGLAGGDAALGVFKFNRYRIRAGRMMRAGRKVCELTAKP